MPSPRAAGVLCTLSIFIVAVHSTHLPNITNLTVGKWNELVPDTTYESCLVGGNFSFFVKPSQHDPTFEYLHVNFGPGGMCTSAESCSGAEVDLYTCQIVGAAPEESHIDLQP